MINKLMRFSANVGFIFGWIAFYAWHVFALLNAAIPVSEMYGSPKWIWYVWFLLILVFYTIILFFYLFRFYGKEVSTIRKYEYILMSLGWASIYVIFFMVVQYISYLLKA